MSFRGTDSGSHSHLASNSDISEFQRDKLDEESSQIYIPVHTGPDSEQLYNICVGGLKQLKEHPEWIINVTHEKIKFWNRSKNIRLKSRVKYTQWFIIRYSFYEDLKPSRILFRELYVRLEIHKSDQNLNNVYGIVNKIHYIDGETEYFKFNISDSAIQSDVLNHLTTWIQLITYSGNSLKHRITLWDEHLRGYKRG